MVRYKSNICRQPQIEYNFVASLVGYDPGVTGYFGIRNFNNFLVLILIKERFTLNFRCMANIIISLNGNNT